MKTDKGQYLENETSVAPLSERILSIAGGSWLLYDMLSAGKTDYLKSAAAGFLLFRGATGFGLVTGSGRNRRNIKIETTMTVNRPVNEVYDYWRKLENLPLFMDHLESVKELDERKSEWKARIPGGIGTISWKSEIIREESNRHVSWRSLPDSAIENEGTVSFHDAGKYGTRVEVVISYRTPAGKAGDKAAELANPLFEKMIRKDIKNFKSHMETGEVATTEGQPNGRH